MSLNLEDFVKLDDVCESYFHITPRIARRKASTGTLPVPAFRFGPRAPIYVRKTDLDSFVSAVLVKGETLHAQMKSAGAV